MITMDKRAHGLDGRSSEGNDSHRYPIFSFTVASMVPEERVWTCRSGAIQALRISKKRMNSIPAGYAIGRIIIWKELSKLFKEAVNSVN